MVHSEFYKLIKFSPGYQKKYEALLKESLVNQYSGGKTESLTEFSMSDPKGYQRMIIEMRKMKPAKTDAEIKLDIRSKRSSVLKLITQLGIDTKDTASGDWDKVNSFLLQPKIAGKTLNRMNIEELEACIKKLRAIKAKGFNKDDKLKRLEMMN